MHIKFVFVLPLIAICHTVTEAQFVYDIDQSVPVNIDGGGLDMPWAGGINSAQYNTMDLNGDGEDDLVVFDRTGHKIYPFLNLNNTYKYSPEYAFYFPDEIKNWMLLRDFNCDGKKDIFTSHSFGIRVFINETAQGEPLEWREYVTGTDNSGNVQYFLKTKGFTSNINMQMNSSDVPAIVDIDGDSDLDILMFSANGASKVEFHKNFSIERNSNCDSLQFERMTQSWGGFQECECGSFAFNDNDCSVSGGREEHQGGKALLLFDKDNDGDKDVVVSEESCTKLLFMENEGTVDTPVFNSATSNFPNSNNPVAMFFFPAAFYEDVDFDGVKDMLVSPNVGSNVSNSVNFHTSSWFYKNSGSNENPQFDLIQRNFLQSEMIDLGENASPAFGDYDNDGDQDMVIGSYVSHDAAGFKSTLQLYENTGTANEPSFELKDRDYLLFSFLNVFNLKPRFRDVNGDSRLDLVFSATNLSNFSTNVYYFLNESDGKFSFSESAGLLFSNIGLEESFEVYDISQDGLVDILIGKSTGKLEYYRNIGSADAPDFVLEDDTFYDFDFSTSRLNLSIAIADLNGDGAPDMVAGDKRGSLAIYDDFLQHIDAPEDGLSDLVLSPEEEVRSFNFGGKLFPAVVNLFNEDKPALVIGTGQGGIQILRNTGGLQGHANRFDIDGFPNPVITSKNQFLKVSSRISGNATIISVLGQQVTEEFYLPANTVKSIPVTGLQPGIYIVILASGGKDYVNQRFIVID